MRRKSERNKTKGSPEKKVEKPTRKSARRRGKRATSSSPERDDSQEDTTSDASLSREKDLTRLQSKDVKAVAAAAAAPEQSEPVVAAVNVEEKDSSPETEDNGSVWKVARADASPGEIQKLKLCRQRNISETSDNSSNRKKSHKWQGSGEGTAEEIDSNDERLNSPQVEFSDKRPDDVSSLSLGQDSNQEVSDYKEALPESTSANLSDDKPNIDLQGDINEASCFTLDIMSEPTGTSTDPTFCGQLVDPDVLELKEMGENEDNQEQQQQQQQEDAEAEAKEELVSPALVDETPVDSNLESKEGNNDILPEQQEVPQTEEKISSEQVPEAKEEIFQDSKVHLSPKEELVSDDVVLPKEECQTQEPEREVLPTVMEIAKSSVTTPQRDQESPQKEDVVTFEKDDRNDSSSDEDQVKVHSDSNSIDEAQMNVRSSIRASSRSNRRKNRSKYRESSYSDTPESEDDPSLERKSKQPDTPEEEEEEEEEELPLSRDRSRSKSLVPNDNSSLLNSKEREEQVDEENEKNDNNSSHASNIHLEAITSSQKPAKINLKRTFGTRNSADEIKVEESNLCEKIDSSPVKTNHTSEKTEQKRVPKRRRWGTVLSTDTSIEFSVSTDSLKVLVPGAKPLSITEVRLSKDVEEEQFRDKSRDKHNTSDSNGEYIVREETIASKNEGSRKGDTKADNHMGSRRKISVVKDIPQTMLTSPSIVKVTNVLLIKNLVRPFTLTQIKELLSRTGTILENGFWMDRIKSKCYVQYSNEDQAFETRQALHGISWPLSNPKKLQVEYATKEDMELAQESSQDVNNSRKDDSFGQTDSWQHDWIREERNQTGGVKVTVVREWDLGKEDGQQHVLKDDREKKEMEKKKRQRSQSPVTEIHLPAPARKFKKKEDEPPPAKLLDDLFRKTKATPCIYWLPLTNEQIVVKEEMRRQHMAEHARRLEEMRRAERNRDHRRRRTPRK
ncbi:apoptotic chromatin condensation inducer in the nucleus [Leptopilina heterotoma]|uniref:apoptotic chromatin condensation inducer in the nucleus n=1 Tax=Leptopilina heterotoma TaxID=63436 RepID=UPI001CA9D8AE|nr:apoptotic chromatin condensation inducer in the nucleus [Leptopilina heterotoma]